MAQYLRSYFIFKIMFGLVGMYNNNNSDNPMISRRTDGGKTSMALGKLYVRILFRKRLRGKGLTMNSINITTGHLGMCVCTSIYLL